MKTISTRIRILSICILCVAFLMLLKLYFLQVIKHQDFVDLADRQYVKTGNRVSHRGSVFFTNKDGDLISAATQKSGYIITINPKILKDYESVYEKVSQIIEIDKEDFVKKATKVDDPYEEIAKRVPEDKKDALMALKIEGLSAFKDEWRFYPGGRQASHILGFLAYKEDDLAGRYGLERYYDETLSHAGQDLYANFFVEIFSNIKKRVDGDKAEGDIVSSIEPTVQATLEDALKKINSQWSSAETSGIIMDPNTGEIIAMASMPDFDPNSFSKEENIKVFSNPLVEDVREMGSIIKPLTVAAGLNEGVINANTIYNDKGSITLNTETIYNYDKKARGNIDIQTALSNSLNMGMVFVMQKIGIDKFSKYMLGFGLGEKTNIDLPNEAQSIVNNLNSNREIEHATASFGQGIALTPLATIRALSVLANGGYLVTPHLIKKVNYKGGGFKNIEYPKGDPIIKKETSEEISRMLVELVDKTLLDGKAKNTHYSVAAKTGTAQIANPENGGYYSDRFLHSFMGYFPAFEPKFIILIYTVNPKGVSFAANTLAEPFLGLSRFLINYYEIPPDR